MIPERDYEITGYVNGDIHDTAIYACDSLARNYDATDELDVLIDDVAERFVPIFREDLIKVIWHLESHIGQVLDDGLVDTDPRNFSLLRMIQTGYYQFLTETLAKNLNTIVFNYLVQAVNEDAGNKPYEDEIEKAIDVIALNVSHNSTFADYERRLRKAIVRIKHRKRCAGDK